MLTASLRLLAVVVSVLKVSAPASYEPWVALKAGSKSADVKSLQVALKTIGYEPGTVDGLFDAHLAAVLCAYAATNALTCDPKTVPEPLARSIFERQDVATVAAELHAAIAAGKLWDSLAKTDARTVAAVQTMLGEVGYLAPGGFSPGANDMATSKALNAFWARQNAADLAHGIRDLLEAHDVLEARHILVAAAQSSDATAFLDTIDAPNVFATAYKEALPAGDPSIGWIADGLRVADLRLQALAAGPASPEEQRALLEALTTLGYAHPGDTDLIAAATRFALLRGLRPSTHGVPIEVVDAITRELARADHNARIARMLAQPSVNEAWVFTEATRYPSFQAELKKLLRGEGFLRDGKLASADVDRARRAWPNTELDDAILVALGAFASKHGIACGDGVIAGDRKELLLAVLRARREHALSRRIENARAAGILNADLATRGAYLKEVVDAATSPTAAKADANADVPSQLIALYAPNALTHLTLGVVEADTTGPLHALQSALRELGFRVTVDGKFGTTTRDALIAIARDAAIRQGDGKTFSPELLRPLTMRYTRMLDRRRELGDDVGLLTSTLARKNPHALSAMLDAITQVLNAAPGNRSAAAEPLLKAIDKDLAQLPAEQRASWLKIREQFTAQSDDIASTGMLVSSIVGLVAEGLAVIPAGRERDAMQAKLDVLVERNAEVLLATAGAPKNLDAQILMRLAPNLDEAHAEAYASALQAAMQQYAIASLHARAMFIAQVGHETMNFRCLAELGGPSYFARYDGRKDLGNTAPGDGYRYRGRGFIQITGRANYAKAGAQLFPDDPHYLLDDPQMASQPDVAARLAGWFWQDHDLNAIADKQPSSVAFREVTERINGGKVGYSDRVRLYTLILPLL